MFMVILLYYFFDDCIYITLFSLELVNRNFEKSSSVDFVIAIGLVSVKIQTNSYRPLCGLISDDFHVWDT